MDKKKLSRKALNARERMKKLELKQVTMLVNSSEYKDILRIKDLFNFKTYKDILIWSISLIKEKGDIKAVYDAKLEIWKKEHIERTVKKINE